MGEPTPGPWSYRSQPHDDWGIVRAGRFIICQARDPASSPELEARARRERFDPFEANARLISAAPDYAAVATNALDMLEQYAGFIRRDVKAADIERHPYLPALEQTIADLRAADAKARGDTDHGK